MTIKQLNVPRGGAYTAPSAEEIKLDTSNGFLLNGSQLPGYSEDVIYSEEFN